MSLKTFMCKLLGCDHPLPPAPPAPVVGGPTIAVLDRSTVGFGLPSGRALPDLLRALQHYVDQIFAPAWGTPGTLIAAADFVPGAWTLVFIDDADVASALGYHDLTPDGLPIGKVFTRTTLDAGEHISVTASHELTEMLVDPSINLLATGVIRVVDAYAYEVADAVEGVPYVEVDGIPLSNFVLPTYFEDFHPAGTKVDYLGILPRAFDIAPDGYMSVFQGGAWTQVFGSVEKGHRFALEDRRQHRSELRARRHRGEQLLRSTPM